MYKVNVNEEYNFEINPENFQWDLLELRQGYFHILINNRSCTAVVLNADFANKSFAIRVGNKIFDIQLKDRFDLLAEQLGFEASKSKKVNDIKAPMPGLVLNIMVEEGQAIKKGESVLILEAMKMENVIKAAGDGVIKSIRVKKGNAVEKNQVMIDLA